MFVHMYSDFGLSITITKSPFSIVSTIFGTNHFRTAGNKGNAFALSIATLSFSYWKPSCFWNGLARSGLSNSPSIRQRNADSKEVKRLYRQLWKVDAIYERFYLEPNSQSHRLIIHLRSCIIIVNRQVDSKLLWSKDVSATQKPISYRT